MLRHHDISHHIKPITHAHFFECVFKERARFRGSQIWPPLVATERDEVKITPLLFTNQPPRHALRITHVRKSGRGAPRLCIYQNGNHLHRVPPIASRKTNNGRARALPLLVLIALVLGRSTIPARAMKRYMERIMKNKKGFADNTVGIKHRNLRDRVLAFEHYGGSKCACCLETEFSFLSLDHKDGKGNLHRRELFGNKFIAGHHMYRKLRELHFPEGFQVLCMNCQVGRRDNGGVCRVPHISILRCGHSRYARTAFPSRS